MARFLDLGSGLWPFCPDDPEWFHADLRPFSHIEFVGNLGTEIFWRQFCSDYWDGLRASQFIEHLDPGYPIKSFFDGAWRVLKPDGVLVIDVPHFPFAGAIMHPDHKSLWIPESFAVMHVPLNGIDMLGFYDHFWHICEQSTDNKNIHVVLTPNKKGITRYEFVPVFRDSKELT